MREQTLGSFGHNFLCLVLKDKHGLEAEKLSIKDGYTPLITTFMRQVISEFKTSLVFTQQVPSQPGLHSNTLSQQNKIELPLRHQIPETCE